MTKSGQCFECYDDAMFRYYGQTGKFNPRQIQLDYVSKLTDGDVIDCVTCGRKMKYVKTGEEKWRQEATE